MKIKYPSFFNNEILEAKLVEMPSFFERNVTRTIIELTEKNIQIEPPANDCIIVSANQNEIKAIDDAGYTLIKP